MPAPVGRDAAKTKAQLEDWFRAREPGATSVSLESLGGPEETGFSSDTLMFDLLIERPGGEAERQPIVVRLEPATPFPIFPEYDLGLQFHMMQTLEREAVPVPHMVAIEPDRGPLGAPFYVMERLEGRVPTDTPPYHSEGWIADLDAGERAAMWFSALDAMAEVHKLDAEDARFDFLARPAAGQTALEAQLAYWDHYLDWGMQRADYPLLDRALAWLRENQPREEPVSICWGDSRISNQMFDGTRCIAVIDWEMAFRGNPEADLAWFITLDRCFTEGIGIERLAGMPDRDTTIARWEERVGRRTEHYDYYECFALFRFSAIMARVMLQLKYYEKLPKDVMADRDNLASLVLERVLVERGA
jgi:aminoglycoside phosphotransferase (APT) family kinase protein